MVHGLAIANGEALWYKNRAIRSNAAAEALGVAPAPGPRHGPDTVNTNVVNIGGRTFALIEAGGYPVELSRDLETQAYNDFDGTLKGAYTAHPHLDPLTGENHAICYDGFQRGTLSHVVIDRGGQGDPRGADHDRAFADDPRLHDHAALCDHPRPPRRFLDGSRDGGQPLPVQLAAGTAFAHRPDAAQRHAGGHHLVPGRSLLRLPRGQCL